MIEPSRLGFYSDIGYKAIETQHMLRLCVSTTGYFVI